MKKVLSLALATAVCVSVVACAQPSTTLPAATTDLSSTSGTDATTGGVQIFAPDMTVPTTDTNEADTVSVDIDGYATLVYNPLYCNVAYKVESNVGVKKDVTVSIVMKDGYVFDGWSRKFFSGKYDKDNKPIFTNGPIANGGTADSTETTYTYTVQRTQKSVIYANYSAVVTYDPNGGTVAQGGEAYTQKYSVTGYKCPNTLPDQGFFSRDGYTLVEYNTKADGSGTAVSLGSKIALEALEGGKLYCIWEKQNDAADFEISSKNGFITITKYKGTSDNVVIPEKINGKNVSTVADGAFTGTNVKRVVLSKNITTVEEGAFADCKKLESFVMFDSLVSIKDASFTGSPLKNLQINAVLNLYDNWTVSYAAPKMDRLIWAKANGKKVIAIYGGSGSLFGWDCEAIEDAFGDEYVVVNLGTNANATAAMFFDCFADVLAKDDVVLWSPEPGEWTFGITVMGSVSKLWSSPNPKSWEINAAHYDIFRDMDISKYSLVFDSYERYASAHKSAQKKFDAFADSVNAHGDAIDNTTSNGGGYNYEGEYERREALFKDDSLDHMAEQIALLTSKGVKVFHTYAAMDANGKESIDNDYIKNTFEKVFTEKFKGIEIISDINNCFVPGTQIRDSAWHLTREGAEARTSAIIADLKAALGK